MLKGSILLRKKKAQPDDSISATNFKDGRGKEFRTMNNGKRASTTDVCAWKSSADRTPVRVHKRAEGRPETPK